MSLDQRSQVQPNPDKKKTEKIWKNLKKSAFKKNLEILKCLYFLKKIAVFLLFKKFRSFLLTHPPPHAWIHMYDIHSINKLELSKMFEKVRQA